MFITSTFSKIRSRSLSPYFHAPVILPYILKTISWINVILGILVLCDTAIDILTNVGHHDLYFIVQWFCLISWMLFDVWAALFGIGGGRGVAKVSCTLPHRGVKLRLAYSWARPAILVACKGRGEMFLFLLFLHFDSCFSFFSVPFFHLLYYLSHLFSPFLWETTQNDPHGLTCC